MSYLVIARKFRPQTFAGVSGQEHVTRTLQNAISRKRVGHAYLFAGPRGVGKTSVARIFAKALNCRNGPAAEPCSHCVNCVEIASGINLAVREIDGASHNSVDNVRDLIDSFRALPPPGSTYKVYIIDEVHMFSSAAFNALLKSLEEPPPHTVFILATTEVHKIPETVLSRCQRHDFRAISQTEIAARISEIVAQEKIAIDSEAIRMISRLADGSMRDAQSLLERVHAFCEGTITGEQASLVLGTVARAALYRLSQAIFARNADEALAIVHSVFTQGVDAGLFLREFATHFRELLLAKFGGAPALEDLRLQEDDCVELTRQAASVSEFDMQDLVQLAREGSDFALRSSHPKYALEGLVVRMATREPVESIARLIHRLDGGEGERRMPSASSPPRHTPVFSGPPESNKSEVATHKDSVSGNGSPVLESTPLDWPGFVRAAADASRILAEHLKRLAVSTFSLKGGVGVLEATGPEFNVGSLMGADTKKKLEGVLTKLVGGERWEIRLTASQPAGGAEAGSLLHQEQEVERRSRVEKQADIRNHPSIKSLQKLFPGSTIENIKIKE